MATLSLHIGDRFTVTTTSPYRVQAGGPVIVEARTLLCEVAAVNEFMVDYRVIEILGVTNPAPWSQTDPSKLGGGFAIKHADRINATKI